MLLIPRVFHRIWLGRQPMPAEFEAFGATWLQHHPGWKMKLWTEANLPPLVNRWAFQQARTLAGRSDVARYEILFRCGGIYVDTDFECLRNLERLIDNVASLLGRTIDKRIVLERRFQRQPRMFRGSIWRRHV